MEGQHIVHTDLPVRVSDYVSELAAQAGCSKRVMVRALIELAADNVPAWRAEARAREIVQAKYGPMEGQLSLLEEG